MRGSTRKRGNTWTAFWDATDPVTGKRRQKSKGGFRTQKAAQQHLATVLVAVADGTYSEPSKDPLAHYLTDEWLPGISATIRPLTVRRYAAIVNSYIKPRELGTVPLRSLTGAHLNRLYAELEAEGLSIATRRLTHAVVRRALNDAVRWGKLTRNPASAADPPSLPRSRAESWSPRELRTFLDHVADDRLYRSWRLAATTGMRRGELLGLTWRRLDLDAARLSVEQQLVPTRGGVTFGEPKSRRSRRTIALDVVTVDALRKHRDTQLLERDFAADAYQDHDLVFADALGGPIHPQRLTQWFAKHRKAAGIPTGLTAHPAAHGRDAQRSRTASRCISSR